MVHTGVQHLKNCRILLSISIVSRNKSLTSLFIKTCACAVFYDTIFYSQSSFVPTMSENQAGSFKSHEITDAITNKGERQGCRKCWKSRNIIEKGSVSLSIIFGCALITLAVIFSRSSNESSTAGVVTDSSRVPTPVPPIIPVPTVSEVVDATDAPIAAVPVTENPTEKPSGSPTEQPSSKPTSEPSESPTEQPTSESPTEQPTSETTRSPTVPLVVQPEGSTTFLIANQQILSGDAILLPSFDMYLKQQDDGNLVLYMQEPEDPVVLRKREMDDRASDDGPAITVLWEAGVAEKTGVYHLTMESDGNMNIREGYMGSAGKIVWTTGANEGRTGNYQLRLNAEKNGVFIVDENTNETMWNSQDQGMTYRYTEAPSSAPPTAAPIEDRVFLLDNQNIQSGKVIDLDVGVSLRQEENGKLVLYKSSSSVNGENTIVWESSANVANAAAHTTTLQGDGHMITRNSATGDIVWKSDAWAQSGKHFLAVNADLSGLIILKGTPTLVGSVLWSSTDVIVHEPSATGPIITPNSGLYTYYPGNLNQEKLGISLSKGLDIELIAKSGDKVQYANGERSSSRFHFWADAGHAFAHPDGIDKGYVYVSNSEGEWKKGGVGAIYFDKDNNVLEYKMLLEETTKNCGGGHTPWGTWVSCEEHNGASGIFQVDPWDSRAPQLTALGDRSSNGKRAGVWESFCYDVSNPGTPRFFFSEDTRDGPVRRFTPTSATITTDKDKMWDMLNDEGGLHEYILLNRGEGTFRWTQDLNSARNNAFVNYQNIEGIDFRDGHLFFVSKRQKELFDLDIEDGTFKVTSTNVNTFSNPDQIDFLVRRHRRRRQMKEEGREKPSNASNGSRELDVLAEMPLLYGTEDGGKLPGIFAMDIKGRWFSILEMANPANDDEETSGFAFSPDKKSFFFCLQDMGLCYRVWRKDGYTFDVEYLNIKYHNAR